MEWNEKKPKEEKPTLAEPLKPEKIEGHTEENIEKNTSSNPTSRFEKKHGRTHNAFGDGHEPGTIPGGGV